MSGFEHEPSKVFTGSTSQLDDRLAASGSKRHRVGHGLGSLHVVGVGVGSRGVCLRPQHFVRAVLCAYPRAAWPCSFVSWQLSARLIARARRGCNCDTLSILADARGGLIAWCQDGCHGKRTSSCLHPRTRRARRDSHPVAFSPVERLRPCWLSEARGGRALE